VPIKFREAAHRQRGGSEGKGSEAHGGHGGGRCWGREGPRWHFDGEQGRAAELRGVASAFWWPEGRRAIGKWLDSFYVMMWCWWGACSGLRGVRAAGALAHRRSGPVVLVQEREIG
jgi:hypothetical protein